MKKRTAAMAAVEDEEDEEEKKLDRELSGAVTFVVTIYAIY